jgi:hypothetical protein
LKNSILHKIFSGDYLNEKNVKKSLARVKLHFEAIGNFFAPIGQTINLKI